MMMTMMEINDGLNKELCRQRTTTTQKKKPNRQKMNTTTRIINYYYKKHLSIIYHIARDIDLFVLFSYFCSCFFLSQEKRGEIELNRNHIAS